MERMLLAWPDVERAQTLSASRVVSDWENSYLEMCVLQRDLEDRGVWVAGPRTLVAALGFQYGELALTAGLAWLLRPDGHHRLGRSVLVALLDRLHPRVEAVGNVRIVLEDHREVRRTNDQREITRADLVVYGPTWTLVVESKVLAGEQPEQLDRLHELWRDDPDPEFAFLTRGLRPQTTAVKSSGLWQALTWRDVAAIVRSTADRADRPAPGVYDYIQTLEAYHDV